MRGERAGVGYADTWGIHDACCKTHVDPCPCMGLFTSINPYIPPTPSKPCRPNKTSAKTTDLLVAHWRPGTPLLDSTVTPAHPHSHSHQWTTPAPSLDHHFDHHHAAHCAAPHHTPAGCCCMWTHSHHRSLVCIAKQGPAEEPPGRRWNPHGPLRWNRHQAHWWRGRPVGVGCEHAVCGRLHAMASCGPWHSADYLSIYCSATIQAIPQCK